MDGILNNVVRPLNCNSENIAIDWEDFKNQLDLLFKLKAIDKPEEKKSLLLLLGGQDLRRICSTLPEEGQENSDLDEYGNFLKKLDEFFIQKRSKRFERHVFRALKQKEEEKFDNFVLRLRAQALKCDWSLLQMNDNIVDQIVEGCTQEKLRAKIMERDLDIDEAVQLGNNFETMMEQQKQFKNLGNFSKVEEINKIESKGKFADVTCSRCGHKGHTGAYPNCPALNRVCNVCRGVGHFANRCRSKRKSEESTRKWIPKRPKTSAVKKEVNVLEESDDEENEVSYAFHLGCMDKIPVKIGGIEMEFIVDSGATVNVLSVSDWEWLKGKKVKVSDQKSDPEKKLLAYGSTTPLKVIGSFLAQIEVGKSTKADRFYVLQEGKHSLIGNSLAKSLGILKIGVDINLVEENKSVFPALKGIEVKINLDKEVAPVFQPYRRVPLELEKKVAARIEELVQKDIIEKVDGHSSWASPLVVVPKTNGDIRLCVDMRRANKAVVVETFPFPNIEEMMVKLNGAQVFSKIDIKDAYYQVRLAEDSRDITTFITKGN